MSVIWLKWQAVNRAQELRIYLTTETTEGPVVVSGVMSIPEESVLHIDRTPEPRLVGPGHRSSVSIRREHNKGKGNEHRCAEQVWLEGAQLRSGTEDDTGKILACRGVA